MAFIVCLTLLALVAMANSAPADKPYYDINDAPELFENFIRVYNKNYKDDMDKAIHYEAFVNNLELINKANSESQSATYDINEFADYTEDEKESMHGLWPDKSKERNAGSA